MRQYCPDYNLIRDAEDITEQSGIEEPVSVQTVKDYMRLEGWSGEDSEATEFSFDDAVIADLITSARQYVEQLGSISLIPHIYQVVLTNMGMIELPFSPINTVSSIVDCEGNAVDSGDIKIVGNERKFLKSPTGFDLTVTYSTRTLNDLRPLVDIKRIVAVLYENRGMDINDAFNSLNLLFPSYSRKSAIA